LLLLNAYPHTFSLLSVGVNTDETWTLSSLLPPAVKYVFWDGVLGKVDYFPFCVLEDRQSTSRIVTSMHVLFIPDISVVQSVLMGLTGILLDDGFKNENQCHILIFLIFVDF